ncbi:MAG: RNA polymerase sigma factor FliA [Woeseia sp.]|nr:RNA polymerase sigma factor FliA [Woeseia sp.]MBT8096508.1 RNA polymerase sigma factor FliA [Woeseia sp.]NNE62024.1 RNA polymerase sigma factor FliA [Woeseia sp.]NNL54995.1 RNA polymerase sigma factor FliA [Woeseia sp.]
MTYPNYATNNYVSQNELVTNHLDLVKRIAHHLAARLPASIDINDLMQAGMIGLLEASGNFDESKGASFDTFAGIRIRGAMLDEVRRLDWTPRSVHQKHRKVSETVREIEAETGRPAETAEIVERLEITLEEYHAILADTAGCRLFSLDETLGDPMHQRDLPSSDTPSPDQELNEAQFKKNLADAIRQLPERERLVLSLYYERELNLKEIGAVLGVSESRVCQIHGQALIRLRGLSDE